MRNDADNEVKDYIKKIKAQLVLTRRQHPNSALLEGLQLLLAQTQEKLKKN